MTTKDDKTMRSFDTGATRDTNDNKLDFEGFLSPEVLFQFARFMNMNRLQSDGQLRASDNWQKGIPMDVYMKSGERHFMEWWRMSRLQLQLDKRDCNMSRSTQIEYVGAICGLMFNTMGYLLEWLKKHPEVRFDDDEPTKEMFLRQKSIRNLKALDSTKAENLDDEEEPFVEEYVCSACRHQLVPPDRHPCDCCDEDCSNFSPK